MLRNVRRNYWSTKKKKKYKYVLTVIFFLFFIPVLVIPEILEGAQICGMCMSCFMSTQFFPVPRWLQLPTKKIRAVPGRHHFISCVLSLPPTLSRDACSNDRDRQKGFLTVFFTAGQRHVEKSWTSIFFLFFTQFCLPEVQSVSLKSFMT